MAEERVQPGAPYLIAMKGHPATGKSTLAEALANRCGWPLLDKDDIKDHLLAAPEANPLAYAILWQLVARQLSLGVSVIADSPLSYPVGYAAVQALAERYQARLLVVETRLAEGEWRRRLDTRTPTASAHKICGWERMQQQLQIYNGCWQYPIAPAHHLVLDTEQPLVELLAHVRVRIQTDVEQDNRQMPWSAIASR